MTREVYKVEASSVGERSLHDTYKNKLTFARFRIFYTHVVED